MKILKNNADMLADKLTDILNNCLKTGIIPDKFKVADISPIFKANDNTLKKTTDRLVFEMLFRYFFKNY